MKTYLLFTGEHFYPRGGMKDFDKDFDSIKEAEEYVKCVHYAMCWHHVVDITTGEIVWKWSED